VARSARHIARDVVILWRCVTLAQLIEPFRVEISQAALGVERRQALSDSLSNLLTAIFTMSSVKSPVGTKIRASARVHKSAAAGNRSDKVAAAFFQTAVQLGPSQPRVSIHETNWW
jgi:hypothetical protein